MAGECRRLKRREAEETFQWLPSVGVRCSIRMQGKEPPWGRKDDGTLLIGCGKLPKGMKEKTRKPQRELIWEARPQVLSQTYRVSSVVWMIQENMFRELEIIQQSAILLCII